MPVLGLIFLRHATTRFYALLAEVEATILFAPPAQYVKI